MTRFRKVLIGLIILLLIPVIWLGFEAYKVSADQSRVNEQNSAYETFNQYKTNPTSTAIPEPDTTKVIYKTATPDPNYISEEEYQRRMKEMDESIERNRQSFEEYLNSDRTVPTPFPPPPAYQPPTMIKCSTGWKVGTSCNFGQ